MSHSARIARGGAEVWQDPKSRTGLWVDQTDAPEGELQIGDVLAILRRNLSSILAYALLGLGLGLAYIALKTPTYTSLTQILVEARSKTAVELDGQRRLRSDHSRSRHDGEPGEDPAFLRRLEPCRDPREPDAGQ